MNQKPSKAFVIRELEKVIQTRPQTSILDLGSGRSINFLHLLKNYPELRYVGLEPNQRDAEEALRVFKNYPNVRIINNLAYSSLEELGQFDIVISLSVLEHVKHLKDFLSFSASKVKHGGQLIHLYDLGHFLYPSSLKERIHVGLCKNSLTSIFIPETKFCKYVNQIEVVKFLEETGINIKKITYHNMPHLVFFLKNLKEDNCDSQKFLDFIIDWELQMSEVVKDFDSDTREKIFPAVCVWGIKQ